MRQQRNIAKLQSMQNDAFSFFYPPMQAWLAYNSWRQQANCPSLPATLSWNATCLSKLHQIAVYICFRTATQVHTKYVFGILSRLPARSGFITTWHCLSPKPKAWQRINAHETNPVTSQPAPRYQETMKSISGFNLEYIEYILISWCNTLYAVPSSLPHRTCSGVCGKCVMLARDTLPLVRAACAWRRGFNKWFRSLAVWCCRFGLHHCSVSLNNMSECWSFASLNAIAAATWPGPTLKPHLTQVNKWWAVTNVKELIRLPRNMVQTSRLTCLWMRCCRWRLVT